MAEATIKERTFGWLLLLDWILMMVVMFICILLLRIHWILPNFMYQTLGNWLKQTNFPSNEIFLQRILSLRAFIMQLLYITYQLLQFILRNFLFLMMIDILIRWYDIRLWYNWYWFISFFILRINMRLQFWSHFFVEFGLGV